MGELLARIDSRELTEWQAYEIVTGPIGDERLDHLFAMLQATIANVNRSKKTRPYEPKQFMPGWGRAQQERKGPMTGEEMLQQVKKLHLRMGGG